MFTKLNINDHSFQHLCFSMNTENNQHFNALILDNRWWELYYNFAGK